MTDDITIEISDLDRGEEATPARARRIRSSVVLRRATLARMLLGSLLVIPVVFVVALLVSLGKDSALVRAGTIDALDMKGMIYAEEVRAFLVPTSEGVVALSEKSTHLGFPVRFCPTSQWFEDPTHGSKWDREGYYTAGPAPRGLDRFRVVEKDGVLYVDPTVVIEGPPRGTNSGHQPEGEFCSS